MVVLEVVPETSRGNNVRSDREIGTYVSGDVRSRLPDVVRVKGRRGAVVRRFVERCRTKASVPMLKRPVVESENGRPRSVSRWYW